MLAYRLYKHTYKPKIDILQTLDGKFIPTVNGKFIYINMSKAKFSNTPEIFSIKHDAYEYLIKWLSIKGLGLKSVGIYKEIKL